MVNLLAGASDVDTNDVLSAVTLTYRVDSTPTGVSGTQLPAGVSLSGSPSTLSLSVDPTDAAFDNLAAGQLRLIVASYTIDDGNSGTVAQTVTITISGTNDAPVFKTVPTSESTTEDLGFAFNVIIEDVDQDESSLVLTANSLDTNLLLNDEPYIKLTVTAGGSGASRDVTIVPKADQFGTVGLKLTV